MFWSWLFLVMGIFCSLGSMNALWPPRRLWFLAVSLFFWGWLTSELALHAVLFQVLVGSFLISKGALSFWPGLVGLFLMGGAILGLLKMIQQGFNAEKAFARIHCKMGFERSLSLKNYPSSRVPI
jgi:hypothetical protein